MNSQARLNLTIYSQLRKRLRAFPFSWPEIQPQRLEMVKALLGYCYENFAFYRERFDSAGFKPERMRALEDLQLIPALSKEEYRDFTTATVNANPSRYADWYQDSTSGSTGLPLKIYRDRRERAYMIAKYLRALFLNGYHHRDLTFCLPSPHRLSESDSWFQRFGLLRRISVPYTAEVERMVDGYRRQKVDLLYANRSQLVLMAEFIKKQGIAITPPRLVCSSGEVLDEVSRAAIEEVFGAGRLFEVYGAVEFNNLAFQLAGARAFHFNHDTDIIELEDEKGRINAVTGRCLVTDLHIRSFPLVRYRLDDWIEMADASGAPMIRKIVGRSDDWLILPGGEKKPFHAVYEIMEKESDVRRFRFVQHSTVEIELQLVTDARSSRTALEARLLAALQAGISPAIRFRFQYFDALPIDASGKLRMVVSKVRQGAPA
jgi:phenylacetate-coenzyme A ligase PaaK-like adenylate-forming protein